MNQVCYKNKHLLIFSLRIVENLTFCIDQLLKFTTSRESVSFWTKVQRWCQMEQTSQNIKRKTIRKEVQVSKKKQGHKLVFFAWQKDHPQNELLLENHHVKLHDYFGWGVFWDKSWKVIVGNDIIVRNNKHVELSGNQSAITID